MLANEPDRDQMTAFFSAREALIKRLLVNQDHQALFQMLQDDRKQIADLKLELKKIGESICNINNMQQYVCCMSENS